MLGVQEVPVRPGTASRIIQNPTSLELTLVTADSWLGFELVLGGGWEIVQQAVTQLRSVVSIA